MQLINLQPQAVFNAATYAAVRQSRNWAELAKAISATAPQYRTEAQNC